MSSAEWQSSQVQQGLSLQVGPEPYTDYCAQLFLIPCEVKLMEIKLSSLKYE